MVIEKGRFKRVEPIINLKMETYNVMEKNSKTVDPSLKLGTGDDEIVDMIIKSTKLGMSGIGSLFNGESISQIMKQKPKSRESTINAKSFVSIARDEEQSKLMDK